MGVASGGCVMREGCCGVAMVVVVVVMTRVMVCGDGGGGCGDV